MKYIILAAGQGTRLHPITLDTPKSMFSLDENTNIIQRIVSLIRKYNSSAEIIVVTGFMHDQMEKQITGVSLFRNPFYEITNSIASLWFVRDLLESGDGTVIMNGDIVMEDALFKDILTIPPNKPTVLIDTSIKHSGDYNVRIKGDKIVVMSKELTEYDGEYAGVTMIDAETAKVFANEIKNMVNSGRFNEWYENVLVQMIFRYDFRLYFRDISEYEWVEVDSVDDLGMAKAIHQQNR